MKKKLICAIIFLTLFLMSSATMVTPVRGYEPPDIPAEAKGATVDDTEVVIYDEDAMEDSLGKGFDIKDIKDGDADVVGARNKYKITDWETDEDLVNFEEDFVYAAVDFEESADTIRVTLWELGNLTTLIPDELLPPIVELIKQITFGALGGADPITTSAIAADAACDASISSWDVLMGIYADEYDGTILERELWYLLDPDEEYDADADVDDDEVPWLLDPRDWLASYYNLQGLGNYIAGTCDSIQAQLDAWYGQLAADFVKNATVHGAMAYYWPSALLLNLAGISSMYPPYVIDYPLGSYVLSSYIVQNVRESTLAAMPSKFGYLVQLLESGLPCASPEADFIKKVVDEFNIKDDTLYKFPYGAYGDDFLGTMGSPGADLEVSAIPYGTVVTTALGIPIFMGGETIYLYGEADVDVDDDGTVTCEFEYQEGQIDPRDQIENTIEYRTVFGTPYEPDPSELDDWEWVFPKASDADTIMKDGDEIFYQTHPIEAVIPGYEVTIVLGVSAVSIIGLIYVVMRKRRQ